MKIELNYNINNMKTRVDNKCKSFTSLEQSKKLAEILPLESADMWWLYITAQGKYIAMMHEEPDPHYLARMESYGIKDAAIRCWSLAALLDIIPQEIFDGEYIINITEGCDNRWILTYDHFENRNHSYYSLSIGANNLVDACYKLILKLNELNLL